MKQKSSWAWKRLVEYRENMIKYGKTKPLHKSRVTAAFFG